MTINLEGEKGQETVRETSERERERERIFGLPEGEDGIDTDWRGKEKEGERKLTQIPHS